jgi:hypothetical protein
MIIRGLRDAGEFPALVIAAFFVRNTGLFFVLLTLTLFAFVAACGEFKLVSASAALLPASVLSPASQVSAIR